MNLTPWVRSGLARSGIDRAALSERLPAGYQLYGWADSAHGPFGFRLILAGQPNSGSAASAGTIPEIPAAIDRLFADAEKAAEDALEAQLAASLAARGIEP